MRRAGISLIAIGVLVLAIFSCSDKKSTGPTNGPLLKIVATDPQGRPVPNLRVSIGHHLDMSWLMPKPAVLGATADPMIATKFRFDLPVACSVSVRLCDLDGTLAYEPLVESTYAVGVYEAYWIEGAGAEFRPNGVYKCVMRTFDNTGQPLFRDSIFAALWEPDPTRNYFGFTAADGSYEDNDRLRFPSLLNLPQLHGADETGTPLGAFSYTDTVTIVLTDTLTDMSQEYVRVLSGAGNLFNLTWSPLETSHDFGDSLLGDSNTGFVEKIAGPIPAEFMLYQNCPNPFN